MESLRWELSRNGQLRFMCGFNSQKDVPRADVYSRFFKKFLKKKI
ncbi:transposase [Thermoanaerobacterium thermosaccharolyticum]